MKILYTGEFKEQGPVEGPVKAASRIYRKICGWDADVRFTGYFRDGQKYSLLKKLFGREINGKLNGNEVELNGIFRLIITVGRFRPDILHIATFNRYTLPVILMKRIFGFKLVYSLHGFVSDDEININENTFLKLKNRLAEKTYIKMADRIITYSEWSSDKLVKKYDVRENKIELSYHGIDRLFIKSDKEKNKNILRIVTTGSSWRKDKGLQFVLDILQKVSSPFRLTIIGNTEGIVVPEKIKNKIFVTEPGDGNKLADIFRNSDILILGSKKETFSIITLEAMASGIVPFVTEISGMARFIKNEENGFFIDFRNPETNSQQIDILAQDSNKLEKMSQASFKAVKNLTWESAAEQYFYVYKEIYARESKK